MTVGGAQGGQTAKRISSNQRRGLRIEIDRSADAEKDRLGKTS